ncbi:MAG: hypothetical protein MI923_29890 [Phycisphaerales bacterium]|nr:hypothetical protein [Phycisphaerales bacterium]
MAPYEDDFDDEYADYGHDDDLPEMMCPNCRGVVTEDTQKCPHCGDWITPVDETTRGWRRWLFVVAVLLMLLAILRFAL